MPNHCYCELSVSGAKKDIERLIKTMKGETPFDFNGIIKMPQELRGVHKGSCVIDGERVDLWRKENGKDVKIPQEERDKWLQRYGADDWYDWSCTNWGTKWNAFDVGEWGYNNDDAHITFSTAWSPPKPVLEALANKFPGLKLVLSYEDECMNFSGVSTWEKGKQLDVALTEERQKSVGI